MCIYVYRQAIKCSSCGFLKVLSCRAEEINEYSYCSRAVLYVDILLEETRLNFQGLKI